MTTAQHFQLKKANPVIFKINWTLSASSLHQRTQRKDYTLWILCLFLSLVFYKASQKLWCHYTVRIETHVFFSKKREFQHKTR